MANNEKNIISFYDLGRQFIHDIHLTDEVYEKDYEDVRNKRFKSAKLAIEYEVRFYFVLQETAPNVIEISLCAETHAFLFLFQWNELYLTSERLNMYDFESVVILSLTKLKKNNANKRKRAIPAIVGITASAMIRYLKYSNVIQQ